ncbi:histidine kinase [Flavobacteriaceae bacterium UJ101]|nr:histidine kinase [Flavobacteriaceae bacterium UJ101]
MKKSGYYILCSFITISLFSQINLLDLPLVKEYDDNETFRKEVEEAIKSGSPEDKITALLLKANYTLVSDLDKNYDEKVKALLDEAKKRLDKNPDPRNLYLYYDISGARYTYLNKSFERLNAYIEALKIKKEADLIDPYFLVELGLMDHYLDVEDYAKVFDLRDLIFDQIDKYKMESNMKSQIYRMSSLAAKELKEYQKSQKDIDSAMLYAKRFEDSVSIARVYKYQAELDLDQKKYDLAYKNALEAQRLYLLYDKKNISQVHFILGSLAFQKKDYDEAKKFLEKAIESKDLPIKSFIKGSSYYRSILEKENKLDEAYKVLKKEDSIKKDVIDENYYKEILDFELDYQQFQNNTILKEKQQQTRWIVFVLVLSLIGIGLLSLLYYQRSKHVKKLKMINFRLNKFSKIISHDLKSPIRSIGSLATFIKEDEPQLSESSQHYINLIHESVMTTENLILNMLTLSRSENNTLEIEKVSYEEIMNQVKSNLLYDINKSDTKIVFKAKPTMLYGNKTLLIQLFQNFIQNSIKYRSEIRPLVIEIDYDSIKNKILIKDNGIGIDSDNLVVLFEAYYQQKFESINSGIGIGLYIAKMIADLHKIEIKINSEVDEGTVIELYFEEGSIIE